MEHGKFYTEITLEQNYMLQVELVSTNWLNVL